MNGSQRKKVWILLENKIKWLSFCPTVVRPGWGGSGAGDWKGVQGNWKLEAEVNYFCDRKAIRWLNIRNLAIKK